MTRQPTPLRSSIETERLNAIYHCLYDGASRPPTTTCWLNGKAAAGKDHRFVCHYPPVRTAIQHPILLTASSAILDERKPAALVNFSSPANASLSNGSHSKWNFKSRLPAAVRMALAADLPMGGVFQHFAREDHWHTDHSPLYQSDSDLRRLFKNLKTGFVLKRDFAHFKTSRENPPQFASTPLAVSTRPLRQFSP